MQTVPRLINQFVPTHYDLSLTLERRERLFTGLVTIHGASPESTGAITVHAKDLIIESALVDGKQAEYSQQHSDELTILYPDIHAGKHIVVISFSGTITDPMHGIYPCYFEKDGIKKEILATQLESHHAREVFPCVDEPEAKATFDLTLLTEPDIVVLGNMPVKSQRHESDKLVTTFLRTPRMSTYLLAWVAGELHRTAAVTKHGVEVSVWASTAQPADSLTFALHTAVKELEFFNDYFGVPYPLPKCDHVALPDFSVGAMENWGLITYRELALLADPKTTSIAGKRYIAMVIAHELSHQWFGNLVTMTWWNNLWLNESFANLMGYLAPSELYPEWDMWLDFITSASITALNRDSIEGVQSVQTEVNHPDEIGTLFDGAIMYAKGSRLMQMLREYLGETAFRRGLKAYFTSHAYRNTSETNLWDAFTAVSGKDIRAFMTPWITQPGFPVVRITHNDDHTTLSQTQFYIGPHRQIYSLWPIPLGASAPEVPELLIQQSFSTSNLITTELNAGNTAYFIAQYDPSTLNLLLKNITEGITPPADRLKLLHGQLLLAKAGHIPTSSLFTVLAAHTNETSEPVWQAIRLIINHLKIFVEHNPTAERSLQGFTASLAQPQYQRLGWAPKSNEPESDTRLRAIIINLMLDARDPESLTRANDLFQSTPIDNLNPDFRGAIFTAAIHHNPRAFDQLLKYYQITLSAELRDDISVGLADTKNLQHIHTLLDLLAGSNIIRKQDTAKWFARLINNPAGRTLAWQWLKREWSWIENSFKSDLTYDYFPRYAAGAIAQRKLLADYKTFFLPLTASPALTRAITMGISEIESRIDILERDRDAVTKTLLEL